MPTPPAAATTNAPAGRGSGPRTVPNLPGALTRQLSARLSVDATTAMRVALLYGDIEWLAGGKDTVAYSASDYARRQGLHRHTVHTDLRRLLAIGALAVAYDPCNAAVLTLHGLGWLEEQDPGLGAIGQDPAGDPLCDAVDSQPWRVDRQPCRSEHHPPCRGERHPHVETSDKPLSMRSPTIEKSSKTLEKNKKRQEGSAEGSGSKAEGAAAPDGAAPAALLDRLLENFRQGLPAEWTAPERITLSAERSSKISKALAFAGSSEALEKRLRSALAQVPPWYRQTYPQRPDGSRRPAHQFFDVLFRAAASERDCGVEAWHLFAWSEAAVAAAPMGPTSTGADELERARRLFRWECFQWRGQGVAALRLSLAERRHLTGLLEAAGEGIPGTGAIQFADPETDPDPEAPPGPPGAHPPAPQASSAPQAA